MLVLFYVRVRVWCTETETVTQTQKQTRVWVSIRVRVRVRLTGKERIGVASSTQRASERACVRAFEMNTLQIQKQNLSLLSLSP